LIILCLDFNIESDIIAIDTLAKSFSQIFYQKIARNYDKSYIKNEHSLYMLIFTMLSVELDLKNLSKLDIIDNKKIDSIFYDIMIILKDLNNGEIFDNLYCAELFKFSRLLGFLNINTNNYNKEKKYISLEKNLNSVKEYTFILFKNVLILFRGDELRLMIYLSSNVYYYQADRASKTIDILSQAKKTNVLLFKNKERFIKYNKYNRLTLRFNDTESFIEVYNGFNV
jgi:hypothetical protein